MIPSHLPINGDTIMEFSIKAQVHIIPVNGESHTLLLSLPAIHGLMNKLKALAELFQAAEAAETSVKHKEPTP